MTEIHEYEAQLEYDLDTMDGALDRYQLTFDFIASSLRNDFRNTELNMAERRKRYDMILKIRGGYQPEKSKIQGNVTYKWENDKE